MAERYDVIDALLGRMNRMAKYRYSRRDHQIHDCELGYITMGDIEDMTDTIADLRAQIDRLTDINASQAADLAKLARKAGGA